MKIYLVVRCGVICRDVFGCFSTHDLALAGVQRARKIEPDNYHDFVISEYSIDEDVIAIEFAAYKGSPCYSDNKTLIHEGTHP